MKKSFIFSLLIIMSASFIACSSKNILHQPRQLSDEIVFFLQEEGYNTERRGADSLFIAFNKDDHNYFVAISDSDTNPLYLQIGKMYPYDNNIVTKETIDSAAWELCEIKAVKVYLLDDGFYFGIEFFLTDMEHFKATFDKHIEIIDTCIGVLLNTLE